MLNLIFIILSVRAECVLGLSCSDLKKLGTGSKLSLEELKTLSDDGFISCLTFLGRSPLGYQEGKYIWMRLVEVYENDISNIPETELQQLGWIVKALTPRDIKNLTLTDIDTISAFGLYHNLSLVQALAERIREDWNPKEPSDYTFYDLMALNHILCGFNSTDLSVIHPESYKEATSVLSKLRDCPKEALMVLASLAVSSAAFSEPSTWHSSQVKSVGCVLNGMTREEITSIPPEGVESITPDLIPCLHKETLGSMTIWQLKHLTPSAAAAVSDIQKSSLSFQQQKAISYAFTGTTNKKTSKASSVTISSKFCHSLMMWALSSRLYKLP